MANRRITKEILGGDQMEQGGEADEDVEFGVPQIKRRLLGDFNRPSILDPLVREHMKVYLRIRPFKEIELDNNESQGCLDVESDFTLKTVAPKDSHYYKKAMRGAGSKTITTNKYTFSNIFKEDTTQKDFFNSTMLDLVKDFIDGQNCLVFSYGVTSSGKTYTIQGEPKDAGVLPRALDVLFNSISGRQWSGMDLKPDLFMGATRLTSDQVAHEEKLKERVMKMSCDDDMDVMSLLGDDASDVSSVTNTTASSEASIMSVGKEDRDEQEFLEAVNDRVREDTKVCVEDQGQIKYSVWVSFAEIYNEQIYDLLEGVSKKKNVRRPCLKLSEDKNGSPYVKGLKNIHVTSADEAYKLLTIGQRNLKTACTKLNHNSSRSHCIFSIKVLRVIDKDTPHIARVSMLSLCDLAGSERCTKTNNTGERLKEAGNINTSLMTLGRCIETLRFNQSHKENPRIVPFRDSKLTRLFQNFFVGQGKAVMIVNVNQLASMYDETQHVFKFSAIASQVIVKQKPVFIKPKLPVVMPSQNLLARSSIMWATTPAKEKVEALPTASNVPLPEGSDDELNDSQDKEEVFTREHIDELLGIIDQLQMDLENAVKSKTKLEASVRKEVCDEMMAQFSKIEEQCSEQLRLREQQTEEMVEKRMQIFLNAEKAKKKHDEMMADGEDEWVSSILLHQERVKVDERNEAIKTLKEEIGQLKTEAEQHKQKEDQWSKDRKDLENQINQLSQANTKQDVENTDDKANLIEYLTQQLQQSRERLQEKDSEIGELNDMLTEAGETFVQKEREIEQLKDLNAEYEKQLEAMRDDIKKMGRVAADTKVAMENADQSLSKQEECVSTLQAEIRSLEGEVIKYQNKARFFEEQIVAKELEINTWKTKCDNSQEEYSKSQEALIHGFTAEITNLKSQIFNFKSQLYGVKSPLKSPCGSHAITDSPRARLFSPSPRKTPGYESTALLHHSSECMQKVLAEKVEKVKDLVDVGVQVDSEEDKKNVDLESTLSERTKELENANSKIKELEPLMKDYFSKSKMLTQAEIRVEKLSDDAEYKNKAIIDCEDRVQELECELRDLKQALKEKEELVIGIQQKEKGMETEMCELKEKTRETEKTDTEIQTSFLMQDDEGNACNDITEKIKSEIAEKEKEVEAMKEKLKTDIDGKDTEIEAMKGKLSKLLTGYKAKDRNFSEASEKCMELEFRINEKEIENEECKSQLGEAKSQMTMLQEVLNNKVEELARTGEELAVASLESEKSKRLLVEHRARCEYLTSEMKGLKEKVQSSNTGDRAGAVCKQETIGLVKQASPMLDRDTVSQENTGEKDKELANKLNEVKKELTEKENELKALTNKLDTVSKEMVEKESEMKMMSKKLGDIENIKHCLEEKLNENSEILHQARSEVQHLKDVLDDKENEITVLKEGQKKSYEDKAVQVEDVKLSDESKAIETFKCKLQQSESEKEELRKQLNELNGKQDVLVDQIKELEGTKEEILKLESLMNDKEQMSKDLSEKVAELEQSNKTLQNDLKAEKNASNTIKALRESIQDKNDEIDMFKENLDATLLELEGKEKVEADIEELRKSIKEKSEIIVGKNNMIDKLEKLTKELTDQLESMDKSALEDGVHDLESAVADKEMELCERDKIITEQKSVIESLNLQIGKLQGEKQLSDDNYGTVKEEMSKLENSLKEKEEFIERSRSEISKLGKDLQVKEEISTKANSELEEITKEKELLDEKNEDLEKKLCRITEEMEVKVMKNNSFEVERSRLQEKLAEAWEKVYKLEDEVEDRSQQISDMKTKQEEMMQAYNEGNVDGNDKKHAELVSDVNRYKDLYEKIESELNGARCELEMAKEEKEKLEIKLKALHEEIESVNKRLSEKEEALLKQTERSENENVSAIAKLQDKFNVLVQEKTECLSEIENYKESVASIKQSCDKELESVRLQLEEVVTERDSLRKQTSDTKLLQETGSDLETQISLKAVEIETLQLELKLVNEGLSKVKAERDVLAEKLEKQVVGIENCDNVKSGNDDVHELQRLYEGEKKKNEEYQKLLTETSEMNCLSPQTGVRKLRKAKIDAENTLVEAQFKIGSLERKVKDLEEKQKNQETCKATAIPSPSNNVILQRKLNFYSTKLEDAEEEKASMGKEIINLKNTVERLEHDYQHLSEDVPRDRELHRRSRVSFIQADPRPSIGSPSTKMELCKTREREQNLRDELKKSKDTIDGWISKLRDAENQLKQKKQELKHAQETIQELEAQNSEGERNVEKEVQRYIDLTNELKLQIIKKEGDLEQMSNVVEDLKHKMDYQNSGNLNVKSDIKKQDELIAVYKETLQEQEQMLIEQEQLVTEREQELEKCKADHKELMEKHQNLLNSKDSSLKKTEADVKKLDRVEAERDVQIKKVNELEAKLSQTKEKLRVAEEQRSDAEKKLKKLEDEKSRLKSALNENNQELKDLEKTLTDVRNECEELRSQGADKNAAMHLEEAKRDMGKNVHDLNVKVRTMQCQNKELSFKLSSTEEKLKSVHEEGKHSAEIELQKFRDERDKLVSALESCLQKKDTEIKQLKDVIKQLKDKEIQLTQTWHNEREKIASGLMHLQPGQFTVKQEPVEPAPSTHSSHQDVKSPVLEEKTNEDTFSKPPSHPASSRGSKTRPQRPSPPVATPTTSTMITPLDESPGPARRGSARRGRKRPSPAGPDDFPPMPKRLSREPMAETSVLSESSEDYSTHLQLDATPKAAAKTLRRMRKKTTSVPNMGEAQAEENATEGTRRGGKRNAKSRLLQSFRESPIGKTSKKLLDNISETFSPNKSPRKSPIKSPPCEEEEPKRGRKRGKSSKENVPVTSLEIPEKSSRGKGRHKLYKEDTYISEPFESTGDFIVPQSPDDIHGTVTRSLRSRKR